MQCEVDAGLLIRLEHVNFNYNTASTSATVLQDITLGIPRNSFLALVGPSGAGKSTLLGLLNGLLKPGSGKIYFQEQDITGLRGQALRELRRKVGIVWQFPEKQLFASTVGEDIAFGLADHLSTEDRQSTVERYMELVGLDPELASRSPFALSGGQQRRVALAGVLAMDPEVLVFDEPTVGLDPMGKQHFLDLILRLHQRENKTIVLVTHDLDVVASSAQLVCILNGGRVHALGAPEHVFLPEVIHPAGLELPLGPYLLAEVNGRSGGLGTPLVGWKEQKFDQGELEKSLVQLVGGGANSK